MIELAVVLVIIGLLLGGGIAALTATTEQVRRSDQKKQLDRVREALYGFAMANQRLPCPDDLNDGNSPSPDGQEDLSGGSCDSEAGALPWVQLGLGRRDAWGNTLFYRVDPDFADVTASGASFDLTDAAGLEIRASAGGSLVADDVPAVVVSYGPQGGQVWTSGGFECPGTGSLPASGFSADETENCDPDQEFVDADYRDSQADDGRFDDLAIWAVNPVLKSRMVDAGHLP